MVIPISRHSLEFNPFPTTVSNLRPQREREEQHAGMLFRIFGFREREGQHASMRLLPILSKCRLATVLSKKYVQRFLFAPW